MEDTKDSIIKTLNGDVERVVYDLIPVSSVNLNDPVIVKREFRHSEIGLPVRKARVSWQETLAAAVARGVFCDTLCTIGSNNIIFVGRQNDVNLAVRIYSELCPKVLDAANRQYVQAYYRNGGKVPERGYKQKFIQGALIQINRIIRSQSRHILTACGIPEDAILDFTLTAMQPIELYLSRYEKASSLSKDISPYSNATMQGISDFADPSAFELSIMKKFGAVE